MLPYDLTGQPRSPEEESSDQRVSTWCTPHLHESLVNMHRTGDFFLAVFIVLNNWGSFDVISVGSDLIKESLSISRGLEGQYKKTALNSSDS